jgi:hypothetical protein
MEEALEGARGSKQRFPIASILPPKEVLDSITIFTKVLETSPMKASFPVVALRGS